MNFKVFRKGLYFIISALAYVPFLAISIAIAFYARRSTPVSSKDARLVWGPAPIINNKYWSNSMKAHGYNSRTYMYVHSPDINKRSDYDEYVCDRFPAFPLILKLPLLFWESLLRFDVFVVSYSGWLLGSTILWRLEPFLLKMAGKKIVVIPYGSDAYIYRRIRSIPLLHGLMMSYPECSRIQDRIENQVDLWTQAADCVNPGVMGIDGIGRWDVLLPSSLCLDTEKWRPGNRNSAANGVNDTVHIVHAPNHTGFKGTEFVLDAIGKLKAEGLKVELILLQKVQNDEVCRVFHEDADILVEQLICTGHGINAVEGMASGLPVMSNLEDEDYTTIFRRCSFLNECPIVSTSPETILEQLRKLVTRPELRRELGLAGRQYVEKYYTYEASAYLFTNIVQYVYGEVESIINLYHPVLGDYPNRMPKVQTSLIKNRIVD